MKYVYTFFILFVISACSPKNIEDSQTSASDTAAAIPNYLYVASGACYSGNGNTTFTNTTASNLVYRINTVTGQKDITIADYSASPSNAGDSPVSIVDYSDTHLLVLVENTTTASLRRIELVEKKQNGSRSTFTNNTTALSAQLRRMRKLNDGFLLVSKSTNIEKMRDGTNRLLAGTNPWITLATPTSSCTTSNVILTDMIQLASGLLMFAHAGTGQARIGTVNSLGYSIAGDCRSAQSAPSATAFPTTMNYDSSNTKLLTTYSGNTNALEINSIYAYSINNTTGAISSPQKIYDLNAFGSTYNYFLYGMSASALDVANKKMYIASAISSAATVVNYKIEQLNYEASQIGVNNSAVLTTTSTTPFFQYGYDTKCISDLVIGR